MVAAVPEERQAGDWICVDGVSANPSHRNRVFRLSIHLVETSIVVLVERTEC